MCASKFGYKGCLRLLIAAGANLDQQDMVRESFCGWKSRCVLFNIISVCYDFKKLEKLYTCCIHLEINYSVFYGYCILCFCFQTMLTLFLQLHPTHVCFCVDGYMNAFFCF